MGLIIGELVYIAASMAFLADLKDTARSRTALRALHLLFVLVGLEVAVASAASWPDGLTADLPWVPGWTGPVLAVGNMFGLAMVPLLALKSYPERRAAMVAETFGPILFGLALSGARVALGGAPMTWQAPILEALTFLGLHHAVLFSLMLALALLRPPFHAAAAELPLTARLRSGFGLFFLALIALWTCQAGLALALHGATAFADGLASGLVSLALLVTSVAGSARTLLPTLTSLGPRARGARE